MDPNDENYVEKCLKEIENLRSRDKVLVVKVFESFIPEAFRKYEELVKIVAAKNSESDCKKIIDIIETHPDIIILKQEAREVNQLLDDFEKDNGTKICT